MEVEVRYAETGHHMKLEAIPDLKALMVRIKSVYKIQLQDQKLITKAGLLLRQNDNFRLECFQKTYTQNEKEEDNNYPMGSIACVYLFSKKSMRANDRTEIMSEAEHLKVLEEKCQEMSSLRENIYELKPFEDYFQGEQLSKLDKNLVQLGLQLYAKVKRIVSLSASYKEIKLVNDEEARFCQCQRKATMALNKSLLITIENRLKKKIMLIHAAYEAMKESQGEMDSKGNSRREEVQPKREELIGKLKGRIIQGRKQLEDIVNKIKGDRAKLKEEFKFEQKVVMKFDRDQTAKTKKLKDKEKSIIKQHYTAYVQSLKDMQLRPKDIDALIRGFGQHDALNEAQSDLGSEIAELKSNYISLRNINSKHQNSIKGYFNECEQVEEQIDALEEYLHNIEKDINKHTSENRPQLVNQDSMVSGKNSPRGASMIKMSEQEVMRRARFNSRIEALLQLFNQLYNQEIQARNQWKSYIEALQEKAHKRALIPQLQELLKCTFTPRMTIDYGDSTDRQCLQECSYDNPEVCIMQSSIVEQVDNISEKVGRFLKESQGVPARMKHLQEMLESSCKVFYSMAARKVEQERKAHSKQVERLQQELNTIKEEADIQKSKCRSDRHNLQQKYEEYEAVSSKMLKKMETEIQQFKNSEAQWKLKLDSSQRKNIELNTLLNEEKLNGQALKKDIRELKKKIIEQLNHNQSLCLQFTTLEESKEQLRIELDEVQLQLANSQHAVTKLEKQIKEIKDQEKLTGSVKIDIDSVDSQRETKEEVIALKKQIQYLEEELSKAQQELHKIIMKETEEKQAQTEESGPEFFLSQVCTSALPSLRLSDLPRNLVSITPTLQEGQLCLFLPFGNGLYSAITCTSLGQPTMCMTEEQKHQFNYLLDLTGYSKRVQDFLSECSVMIIARIYKIGSEPQRVNEMDVEVRMVRGRIQYAFGYEDEDITIRNYSSQLSE